MPGIDSKKASAADDGCFTILIAKLTSCGWVSPSAHPAGWQWSHQGLERVYLLREFFEDPRSRCLTLPDRQVTEQSDGSTLTFAELFWQACLLEIGPVLNVGEIAQLDRMLASPGESPEITF